MRALPPQAAGQAGVFTVAQAVQHGWTRSALRHAVGSGRCVVVRRGVLAEVARSESRWDIARRRHAQAGVAIGLSCPGTAVSHAAAAILWGLPVLSVPRRPCVTTTAAHSHHVTHAHLHRGGVPPTDIARRRQVRLTTMARTVVDVAREHGPCAGLVVADAALRTGRVRPDQLSCALSRAGGRVGIARAREAVCLADARSESPLESCSRWWLGQLNVPPPQLQVEIWVDGRFVARVDMYWPEAGVVGEADGLAKYDGDWRALRDEKLRQEALERAGITVVRWGWEDLGGHHGNTARAALLADRVNRALARGLAQPRDRLWIARPSGVGAPGAVTA